jgi:hypothetical protein
VGQNLKNIVDIERHFRCGLGDGRSAINHDSVLSLGPYWLRCNVSAFVSISVKIILYRAGIAVASGVRSARKKRGICVEEEN